MKASELINHLQLMIKEHGDLPTRISQMHPGSDEDQELAGILKVDLTEPDKDLGAKYFLFCDNNTFDVSHVGGES